MTTNDLLLREGIAAAKLGQRERARTLLMQVVEADERNEEGWLWLSGVVDDPNDQRVCLQNVLDINPRNQQAQKGLAWLDAHHPATPPVAELAVPLTNGASAAPPEQQAPPAPVGPTVEEIPIPVGPLPNVENPCPFCGSPTRLDQERCVQCKHSLVMRERSKERRSVSTTLLAVLWAINGIIVLISGSVLAVVFARNREEIMREIATLDVIDPNSIALYISILVFIGIIYCAISIGLWRRYLWAWISHIIVSTLSIISTAQANIIRSQALLEAAGNDPTTARVATGISTAGFACFALFVLVGILLTVLSASDFFSKKIRLLSDVPTREDDEHYNMGVIYKNQGMWYMATKEWEVAVQRRPSDANYRHALGLAYAQIRQFGRGVRELREALRLRTTDQRIKEDLALVEQKALEEMSGR